ncbi:MAG: transcription initiation factor IIB family protein [Candidatus Aenigmatarchaeota archaeon]|nr:MAG: transcription initiation factor IIB family protein [Candidatus Aenigmarchaeota archaeon]
MIQMATEAIVIRNVEIELLTACPECGGRLDTDSRRGETYCGGCGVVVRDKQIDNGRHERAYDKEQADKRLHDHKTTLMRHDRGLGSVISSDLRDSWGAPVGNRLQWRRMIEQNTRATFHSSRSRTLNNGLVIIKDYVAARELPSALEERAVAIYRKAHAGNYLRGRSTEDVAAASLYAAGKDLSLGIVPTDFKDIIGVDKRSALRTYKTLLRNLDGLENTQSSARAFVPRLCEALSVPPRIQQDALELCSAIERLPGRAHKPTMLAAGIVYVAANERGHYMTQIEVTAKANISEPSLRSIALYINQVRERMESSAVRADPP